MAASTPAALPQRACAASTRCQACSAIRFAAATLRAAASGESATRSVPVRATWLKGASCSRARACTVTRSRVCLPAGWNDGSVVPRSTLCSVLQHALRMSDCAHARLMGRQRACACEWRDAGAEADVGSEGSGREYCPRAAFSTGLDRRSACEQGASSGGAGQTTAHHSTQGGACRSGSL